MSLLLWEAIWNLLVAAAWQHDIGYATELAVTGFHPLDGARYVQGARAPDRLTNLVAQHSCAVVEARLRGLDGEMRSSRMNAA